MSRGRWGRLAALVGVAALAWGLPTPAARAQSAPAATLAAPSVAAFPAGEVAGAPCASCGVSSGCSSCGGGVCQRTHCPPHFHHCQERPPVICIHCGCPRPVCNPCALPNFGYFQTCWTPWPLPPDWSHCPVPPPASQVQVAGPIAIPGVPTTAPAAPTKPGTPAVRPVTPPPAGTTLPGITPLPEDGDGLPVPRPLPPGTGGSKLSS